MFTGALSDVKLNYGPGGIYPDASKCSINGKEVPAFISCTSKGSITSKLLKDMPELIDFHNIIESKPGGPTPFLLLDGCGSRLELPFLQEYYANGKENKWLVCLGLPNGKSLWQVGDSSQQNGSYEMYCNAENMK